MESVTVRMLTFRGTSNESRQGRTRGVGNLRLRRQTSKLEREAEAMLAMNTDFHSRLKSYREALAAPNRARSTTCFMGISRGHRVVSTACTTETIPASL